jgi:hypothetical protein
MKILYSKYDIVYEYKFYGLWNVRVYLALITGRVINIVRLLLVPRHTNI